MKSGLIYPLLCILLLLNNSTYASSETAKPINAPQQNVPSNTPHSTQQSHELSYIVEKQLLPAVVNISGVCKEEYRNEHLKDDIEKLFDMFFKKEFLPKTQRKFEKNVYPLGSGFIIDKKGYIVTNHHVIANTEEIKITTHDGKEYSATVVGSDPKSDIAILKINSGDSFNFLIFDDSSKAKLTEPVIIIGSSFGLGGTVTKGIISSTSRPSSNVKIRGGTNLLVKEGLIQTDAAANPGNSGGPLLNLEGKVLGVIFASIAPSGGGGTGITFAIPSNDVKNIANELIKRGKINRGRIGIVCVDVNRELAENIGAPNLRGVLVESVLSEQIVNSGLQPGDVIIKLNDKEIRCRNDLIHVIADAKIHSTAKATVIRNKVEKNVYVKILSDDQTNHLITSNQPNMHFNKGIMFRELDEEIRKKIDFDKTQGGVFVENVFNRKIDLIKGDIIYSVVGYGPIKNLVHWFKICKHYQQKNQSFITVLVKNINSRNSRCVHIELDALIN